MKLQTLLVLASLLLGTAAHAQSAPSTTEASQAAAVAPDNTKKNVRDRHHQNKTPMDQSGKKSDVAVTRELRKSIMAQKGLSVDAQNIKIITEKGSTTLRGPVKSEEEKATVLKLAKNCCGDKLVDQLEVKTTK